MILIDEMRDYAKAQAAHAGPGWAAPPGVVLALADHIERMRNEIIRLRSVVAETSPREPIDAYLEMNRAYCDVCPVVRGTCIETVSIQGWVDRGDRDGLMRRFPELTVAGVDAALAYERVQARKRNAEWEAGRRLNTDRLPSEQPQW